MRVRTCVTHTHTRARAGDESGKEKRTKKNFLRGAMGAVLQAKSKLAAPVRRLKKQKELIDELKVTSEIAIDCACRGWCPLRDEV